MAEMMAAISFRFRLGRPQACQALNTVSLIKAEFKRAMEAARYYDTLKNRRRAEPYRLRIGPGGIPRAVFKAHYE